MVIGSKSTRSGYKFFLFDGFVRLAVELKFHTSSSTDKYICFRIISLMILLERNNQLFQRETSLITQVQRINTDEKEKAFRNG